MYLAAASCFSPTYPEGSPCTDFCPGDLRCVGGRCTRGSGGAEPDASTEPVVCPPDYVPLPATGSSYRIVGAAAPQAIAVDDCADDGARTYLAIPDNLAESNLLDALATNDAWLGITDAAMEGTWVTVRGTPQTFFKWASAQPDGGVGESCAFIRDAAWEDTSCSLPRPYVCECR